MSQMGCIIRAVNKLFRQRDEQLLAHQRNPMLFQAAKRFKESIDDFERKAKEGKNEDSGNS